MDRWWAVGHRNLLFTTTINTAFSKWRMLSFLSTPSAYRVTQNPNRMNKVPLGMVIYITFLYQQPVCSFMSVFIFMEKNTPKERVFTCWPKSVWWTEGNIRRAIGMINVKVACSGLGLRSRIGLAKFLESLPAGEERERATKRVFEWRLNHWCALTDVWKWASGKPLSGFSWFMKVRSIHDDQFFATQAVCTLSCPCV